MIGTPESLSDTPEDAMPQLNDLLHSISLNGGVFLDAEFSAPWCVSAKIGPEDCATFGPLPGSIIAFHYVHEGQLCVTMEGQAPVAIAAGEIVLLPRNDHHHLANGAEVTAVSADDLMEPGAEGRWREFATAAVVQVGDALSSVHPLARRVGQCSGGRQLR